MAIFAKLYKKDINLTPFMVVFHVYNFPHNNQIEVRAEPKNFLVEFQNF